MVIRRKRKGSDCMVKGQEEFFEGLGFQEYEFKYAFGKQISYKGPDGWLYFGNVHLVRRVR